MNKEQDVNRNRILKSDRKNKIDTNKKVKSTASIN